MRVKPFVSTPHVVEFLVPGEPVVDRFGNERLGGGVWRRVKCASWWVDRVEEKHGDSVLRTVDLLHVHVHCPPSAASRIRLPDGSEWEVQGHVEDYNHGFHGWAPGLVVVHAKRVEG